MGGVGAEEAELSWMDGSSRRRSVCQLDALDLRVLEPSLTVAPAVGSQWLHRATLVLVIFHQPGGMWAGFK